jgi:fatty-acyl-CoA synthase
MFEHGDWLRARAEAEPARPLLREAGTGRALSAQGLFDEALRAARVLRNCLGVGPGDRVAVLSGNRLELVPLLFACAQAGAVLVPLNWRLPAAELGPILRDCEPVLLLVEDEFIPVYHELQAATAGARVVGLERALAGDPSWTELLAGARGASEPGVAGASVWPATAAEDPLLLLYTSGSSGTPKGVLLTRRGLSANAAGTAAGWGLQASDLTWNAAPLFHTGGWNVLLLPLLHCGGQVVLARRFDPEQVLAAIPRERITALFGVPTMFADLLAAARTLGTRAEELASLRFVVSGGAPCPVPLVESWATLGVELRQGYGLTEFGPNCFAFPAGESLRRAGTVGLPMPHVLVRLERDDGSGATPGETGELLLAGDVACGGYWRRPDASTALRAAGGFLRTGDLFVQEPDGWFRCVGRKKDMFISGGENVYPAEVERVLLSLPGVAEAAVVGVPDPRWGELGHAFLALREGEAGPGDEEAVRALCRASLAGYKVPRRVRFVDALPRGATGKVQRATLLEWAR